MSGLDDWKRFVELPYFTRKWRSLGLTDDDLNALQIMIMVRPKTAPVVRGTGGLRKIRFAPLGSSRGKSGSLRVGYVYFEEFGVIVLVVVYAKDDQSEIPAQQRPQIQRLVAQLHRWLAEGE